MGVVDRPPTTATNHVTSLFLSNKFFAVVIAFSKSNIPIRLTDERWLHITTGHPEIAGYYYEILETIEDADIIYEGSNEAKIAIKRFQEEMINL